MEIDETQYTMYEATQKQRAIERAMRAQKKKILVAEATGDPELPQLQSRMQVLSQEYSRFSDQAGLRTQVERTHVERTHVEGFGYKQSREVEYGALKYKKFLAEQNRNAIIKEKIRAAGGFPKVAKIHLVPTPIDTDSLGFRDEHINQERKHGVTKEQAISFIKNARISVTVWNGKQEKYFSHNGATYVDLVKSIISTAYKKEEFDNRIKAVMEVINKYGL